MGYLIISEGDGQVKTHPFEPPAEPKGDWFHTLALPEWVMALAYKVGNGIDGTAAINGIGFTDPNGDLLLYRRLTQLDWDRFPVLEGVREVWITFRLEEE